MIRLNQLVLYKNNYALVKAVYLHSKKGVPHAIIQMKNGCRIDIVMDMLQSVKLHRDEVRQQLRMV